MPKLVLLSGTKVAAKFPLTAEKTTLGREDDNDIVLEGTSVSKAHAYVENTEAGYVIEDLGSRNGVLINGTRCSRQSLRDGDEITIGEYIFLYEEDVITENVEHAVFAPFPGPEKKWASETPRISPEIAESDVRFGDQRDVSTSKSCIHGAKQQNERSASDDAAFDKIDENAKVTAGPARLLVLRHAKMIHEYIIQTDIVTIGSDWSNILHLDHHTVSPFHAQIVKEGLYYTILDLETRPGTMVRGMRINQSTLRNGDIIDIGAFSLIFQDCKRVSTPVMHVDASRTEHKAGINEDDVTIVESDVHGPSTEILQYPKLIMIEGPTPGREFLLNKPEMKIGRDSANDIVIKDKSISRLHAIVRLQGNDVVIFDQGSLNGIEINGGPVSEISLKRCDVIKLGTVALRFIERGEVYSIDLFDQTKVPVNKTDDHVFPMPLVTIKGTPILRMLFISGTAFLSFLLALSFFVTTGPPPGPMLSDISDPDTEEQPTRKPVSAISIDRLFRKGKDAMGSHRWEQAVQHFDHVLEIKPDHEEAHILLEQSRTELQNLETLTLAKHRQDPLQDEVTLRRLDQILPSSVYFSAARKQAELIRKMVLRNYLDAGNRYRRDNDIELALNEYEKGLRIDANDAPLAKAKRECEILLTQNSPTATRSLAP